MINACNEAVTVFPEIAMVQSDMRLSITNVATNGRIPTLISALIMHDQCAAASGSNHDHARFVKTSFQIRFISNSSHF